MTDVEKIIDPLVNYVEEQLEVEFSEGALRSSDYQYNAAHRNALILRVQAFITDIVVWLGIHPDLRRPILQVLDSLLESTKLLFRRHFLYYPHDPECQCIYTSQTNAFRKFTLLLSKANEKQKLQDRALLPGTGGY